jgi:outer membrane protein assembly factor BamD
MFREWKCPKMGLVIKYTLVGAIVASLLSGCGLLNRFFGEKGEQTPGELMSKGIENLEKGNYEKATEAFQMVKDRYPYSKFAVEAELKMADAMYKKQEFDEAYEAYDQFEKLHPKNPNIPYVIYQKGMCHFRQVTTIDRDQTHTLKARQEFDRLIRRFPRHEYARMGRRKLRQCLIYLSEYELYVGRFYFKQGDFKAAMGRFSYILENYPDMGQYHEALDYIRRCKIKLSEKKDQVSEVP